MTDESAVSSVVGTVLILAITIVVFGGLSLVVVDYFAEKQQTLRAEVAAQESETSYLLLHRGGESITASGASVLVTVAGNQTTVPLSYFASSIGAGWDLGEALCVAGPDAGCRFAAGTSIQGVVVVAGNEVLLQDQGGGA